MESEKYSRFTADDFLLDTEFTRWVLHPDEKSDRYWKRFLRHHPEKEKEVEIASYLIRSLKFSETEPSIPELDYSHPEKEIRIFRGGMRRQGLKIAAIFLCMVSFGILSYYYLHQQANFSLALPEERYGEQGRIILPDGTVTEFDRKETVIQQTAEGMLTINEDTLRLKKGMNSTDESAMTQVIIPYGKRSDITLADGTRIWLNAGSSLSYPVHFRNDRREVMLSGEAFFDVTPDDGKPFLVITNEMKIKVTGTRFNVTSYQNEPATSAVLLEGKIETTHRRLFSRPVKLSPGERIVYNRDNGELQKEKVNTVLYSSWVEGYLIIENEPVDEIFKKLERYYNQRIEVHGFSDLPRFTGKLNLADDLEKVLRNIAFTGPFDVVKTNGHYIIQE